MAIKYSDEINAGRKFLESNWERIDEHKSDKDAGIPCPDISKKPDPDNEIIPLVDISEFDFSSPSFLEIIKSRRSRRRFKDESISIKELSYLLYCTQGVKRVGEAYSLRSVPSGGARHSIETYIFVNNVVTLDCGLYHYLPVSNELEKLNTDKGLKEKINEALFNQMSNAAMVFLWTSVPYRMEWKYNVTSHKIIAIDAGHVCQNLYLSGESINCGVCAIGAYNQDGIDKLIGVNEDDEFVIYSAIVGKKR